MSLSKTFELGQEELLVASGIDIQTLDALKNRTLELTDPQEIETLKSALRNQLIVLSNPEIPDQIRQQWLNRVIFRLQQLDQILFQLQSGETDETTVEARKEVMSQLAAEMLTLNSFDLQGIDAN